MQFGTDLLLGIATAPVGEDRIAGDNPQPGDLRQVGNQVFRYPVREIVLLRIRRKVFEGQNCDNRLGIRKTVGHRC